jgi:simple sugar transport system substrate-binding protein
MRITSKQDHRQPTALAVSSFIREGEFMKLQRGPQRRWVKTAAVAVAAMTLASCSSTGGKPAPSGNGGTGAGQADTPRITVAMITHEVPGDSFWDLIRKGAQAAADKDNIELRYSSDPEAPNQANLVQSALDSKVAGIAVTLAKPDAMAPAVKAALAANVPVVAFNAGFDAWKPMGIQEYFGQDGHIAGQAAGEKLTAEGAKKVLCVIQEQGQVDLEARCAGVTEGFKGGQVEILNVNSKDMPSVESTITAKLQQDPAVDYVVTLGAPIALAAVQSVGNAGSKAKIATFDTNAALVDSIQKGDVQWAVDQQPFLQGYLAIDSLWLFINNKNVIGGGQSTLTGPAFIDKSNIDAVAALAKSGTR